MADTAVSDAGPLIHLSEIGRLEALGIVGNVLVPPEVATELTKGPSPMQLAGLDWMEVRNLGPRGKDQAAFVCRRFGLDLGEAEAIALCMETSTKLIFTDDLDARDAARRVKLDPHGSVGILLRAYRRGLLSQENTIQSLEDLGSKSSLYLTADLVRRAVQAVKGPSRRR